MKKPAPLNKEVPFGFDELFFSTTDGKGIIEYGNEVFVKISGYPETTLMGAPHNIIRHPDMPKAVFKIFWQTLSKGHPIAAYVKNMAADGSYYWVFAFAFPVSGGYLSIRFKPSSEVFVLVQDIYQDVLKKEKATSMDEAEAYLLKTLEEKGFESYRDFMIHAAIAELKSHETHLSLHNTIENHDHIINRISEIKDRTSHHLNQSFSKIDLFQKSSNFFSDKIGLMTQEFRKLKFLSMNMNIQASNLGENASTLSVISEEFARVAGQIEAVMLEFSKFASDLSGVVKTCSLDLAALKTQMNMVDFFVKESIGRLETSENAFEGMLRNQNIFTNLFSLSVTSLSGELSNLKSELDVISQKILEIQKFINGLQLIKQTGSIESARNDDIKSAFTNYLTEMNIFIALLRDSISELNTQREHLYRGAKEVQVSTNGIKNNINELFRLALTKAP
jgi:PAS domain S-box-containing protein